MISDLYWDRKLGLFELLAKEIKIPHVNALMKAKKSQQGNIVSSEANQAITRKRKAGDPKDEKSQKKAKTIQRIEEEDSPTLSKSIANRATSSSVNIVTDVKATESSTSSSSLVHNLLESSVATPLRSSPSIAMNTRSAAKEKSPASLFGESVANELPIPTTGTNSSEKIAPASESPSLDISNRALFSDVPEAIEEYKNPDVEDDSNNPNMFTKSPRRQTFFKKRSKNNSPNTFEGGVEFKSNEEDQEISIPLRRSKRKKSTTKDANNVDDWLEYMQVDDSSPSKQMKKSDNADSDKDEEDEEDEGDNKNNKSSDVGSIVKAALSEELVPRRAERYSLLFFCF